MKTILITGASSGIGAATAKTFLEAGWVVGLLARRQDRLRALADGHDTAIPLVADVTDAKATEAAFGDFTRTNRPSRCALQQCRDVRSLRPDRRDPA